MPSPEESKHVNIMSSCGVLFALCPLYCCSELGLAHPFCSFAVPSAYFLPSSYSLGWDRGRCWQDVQMDGKLPLSLELEVRIYLDPEG